MLAVGGQISPFRPFVWGLHRVHLKSWFPPWKGFILDQFGVCEPLDPKVLCERRITFQLLVEDTTSGL